MTARSCGTCGKACVNIGLVYCPETGSDHFVDDGEDCGGWVERVNMSERQLIAEMLRLIYEMGKTIHFEYGHFEKYGECPDGDYCPRINEIFRRAKNMGIGVSCDE